jgi:hypothetical protein
MLQKCNITRKLGWYVESLCQNNCRAVAARPTNPCMQLTPLRWRNP